MVSLICHKKTKKKLLLLIRINIYKSGANIYIVLKSTQIVIVIKPIFNALKHLLPIYIFAHLYFYKQLSYLFLL